jgi:hypothetical protein
MRPSRQIAIACSLLLLVSNFTQADGDVGKRGNLGLGRVTDSECSAFLLTEVAYLCRLSQSCGSEPWQGYYAGNNLNYYFSADIGWMKNLRNRNAVGGTLCWSLDDMGSRIAIKPRYRRWLTRTIHADAAIGLIAIITGGRDDAGGFTGNISLGIRDLVSVMVQYETIQYTVYPREGPSIHDTERTLYAGIKIGSTPGAAAMIVSPVVVVVLWVIAAAGSD